MEIGVDSLHGTILAQTNKTNDKIEQLRNSLEKEKESYEKGTANMANQIKNLDGKILLLEKGVKENLKIIQNNYRD